MSDPTDEGPAEVSVPAINRAGRRQLGKFGKKKADLNASFDYFDREIRVHPKLTNLMILGFLDVAEGIDDMDEVASMKAVRDFLHSAIHPDDWKEFWEVSVEERQSMEDFMELQWKLLEKCSENDAHPFTPPSASSDGLDSTEQKSRDDSFSRVMERLDGRPDLRHMVMEATEKRAEAASIN